jgi:hypothetical protein
VGHIAGLDTKARGNILSPLPGIEPRSPSRPARSQTLTVPAIIKNIKYVLVKTARLISLVFLNPSQCHLRKRFERAHKVEKVDRRVQQIFLRGKTGYRSKPRITRNKRMIRTETHKEMKPTFRTYKKLTN